MKPLVTMFKIIACQLVAVLLLVSYVANGQYINISETSNITNLPGDEINPEWSDDGGMLLFNSVLNDRNSLCYYKVADDTLIYLTVSGNNLSNPVWHPDGDKIVFDSKKEGRDYLYLLDLETRIESPLINRDIRCRNASFSSTSRQVFFTGFNELSGRWEIYSYDFIYDNLNPLTNTGLGSGDSDVSLNGKQIVYCSSNPFSSTKNLEVINWYGESLIKFDEFEADFPSWGSSGLKLFFVSNMDNKEGELYSIWKDGSHLERLTNDKIKIANPVVSPDGTMIAMSVLTQSGWDIYILPFDEY